VPSLHRFNQQSPRHKRCVFAGLNGQHPSTVVQAFSADPPRDRAARSDRAGRACAPAPEVCSIHPLHHPLIEAPVRGPAWPRAPFVVALRRDRNCCPLRPLCAPKSMEPGYRASLWVWAVPSAARSLSAPAVRYALRFHFTSAVGRERWPMRVDSHRRPRESPALAGLGALGAPCGASVACAAHEARLSPHGRQTARAVQHVAIASNGSHLGWRPIPGRPSGRGPFPCLAPCEIGVWAAH